MTGKAVNNIGTSANSLRPLPNDRGTVFHRKESSPNDRCMLADSFDAASKTTVNPGNNF